MKGYTGKILNVNLSTGEITAEMVPDAVYERLLTGVGLGAYILYNRIPAGADPLGPDNILGFVSGLLTGTPSLVTGRWMAVCKSPLTGGWGDANCGGTLAPAIKQCGYDGIFISGTASKPVYLFVDDHGAVLRPAAHVWGKDAIAAEEILTAEHRAGKKPVVAVIGQAGEKLSLISGICNDGGRIAARSGCGAVMGSKRLKAVVLAGTQSVTSHDAPAMRQLSKDVSGKIRAQKTPGWLSGATLPMVGKLVMGSKKAAPVDGMMSMAFMRRWGTIAGNVLAAVAGDTPIKNWGGTAQDIDWGFIRNLNPDRIIARETKKYNCHACSIACGGLVDISEASGGEFPHTHKPEYETCAAFGALVLNKDLEAIMLINELLNRAGMDSISAGATVAFAIECCEHGILTDEMTGGLALRWGDAASIVALVKLMIAREGVGDLLADGVQAAAAKLGEAARPYAVTAGGQEPGMHDSRLDPVLGIHFSADPTPGRHTIGSSGSYNGMHLWEQVSWAPNPGSYLKDEEYVPNEKTALKAVAASCYKELTDGAGGCQFAMMLGVSHWNLFDMLNAATGWEMAPDEYMEIGRRIQTLRQLFNVRHGIDPISFKMHPRMAGDPPQQAGPNKGKTVPIEAMMRLYWKAYGWDEHTGVPTAETVAALGLGEMASNTSLAA